MTQPPRVMPNGRPSVAKGEECKQKGPHGAGKLMKGGVRLILMTLRGAHPAEGDWGPSFDLDLDYLAQLRSHFSAEFPLIGRSLWRAFSR